MATTKVEDALRNYLDSLTKPAPKPVVDREAVKALKEQAKSETDPINRLKLLAQAREAAQPKVPEAEDNSGLEAVFIAEAAKWASDQGIEAADFLAIGVPEEVVRKAGFAVPRLSQRQGTRTRAPRLGTEEVMKAIRALPHTWKLSDLAAKIDRDTATTRNYVNKLVESGDVKVLGDDPDHDGRGRAAKLYGRS